MAAVRDGEEKKTVFFFSVEKRTSSTRTKLGNKGEKEKEKKGGWKEDDGSLFSVEGHRYIWLRQIERYDDARDPTILAAEGPGEGHSCRRLGDATLCIGAWWALEEHRASHRAEEREPNPKLWRKGDEATRDGGRVRGRRMGRVSRMEGDMQRR